MAQLGVAEGDEEPLRLSSKKAADDEIDITPMIDIVFLLLIFFIVCSTMVPAKTGAIPSAKRGLMISTNDSALLIMERGTGEKSIIKRHDGTLFNDDEERQRVDIIDYLTQQLDVGKTEVMIVGSKDVSVGEVARVQRIIGDGFDGVKMTYIAVKEE